jgi:hypothetical protein
VSHLLCRLKRCARHHIFRYVYTDEGSRDKVALLIEYPCRAIHAPSRDSVARSALAAKTFGTVVQADEDIFAAFGLEKLLATMRPHNKSQHLPKK